MADRWAWIVVRMKGVCKAILQRPVANFVRPNSNIPEAIAEFARRKAVGRAVAKVIGQIWRRWGHLVAALNRMHGRPVP